LNIAIISSRVVDDSTKMLARVGDADIDRDNAEGPALI
jgi:hypothetical protein